jgi:hypothetical protein
VAKLMYCSLCNRNVEAKKEFNWLVFIFLAAIPYLLFYVFLKRRRCPICKGTRHLRPPQ